MIRLARGALPLLLASVLLSAGCPAPPPPRTAATIRAEDLPSDPAELLTRLDELSLKHDRVELENALVVADRLLSLKPGDPDAAWRAARAAFHLADEADADKERRAFFAGKGIAYADVAVKANDKGVQGYYYRAINRGYLARTKTVGAIDLLKDIHADAKQAVALDEKFDAAGPLRLLGTVLLMAPGWPASFGDPEEAMETLAKAVQLAPEHPLNQLYYGQALLKNDKPAEAVKALEEAVRLSAAPGWEHIRARLASEAEEHIQKARAKL